MRPMESFEVGLLRTFWLEMLTVSMSCLGITLCFTPLGHRVLMLCIRTGSNMHSGMACLA